MEADKRSLGSTGLGEAPLIFLNSAATWCRHHLILIQKTTASRIHSLVKCRVEKTISLSRNTHKKIKIKGKTDSENEKESKRKTYPVVVIYSGMSWGAAKCVENSDRSG